MENTRRKFLGQMGAVSMASVLPLHPVWGHGLQNHYKVLLNSGFSGPQAFFFLAKHNNYLKSADIHLDFNPGSGAADVVPRIIPEGFDIGYGDFNALIDLASKDPENAPVAVYIVFNQTPLTIVVDADGPIKKPKDLEGRSIGGHASDAALLAFPALAEKAGINVDKVSFSPKDQSMRKNVEDMLAGKTAGCFGFVNTILTSIYRTEIDPIKRLRFIEYVDYAPELVGNAVMVSKSMISKNPEMVRELVKGLNEGMQQMVSDPKLAIEAIAKEKRDIDMEANLSRLVGTLQIEMAHPEGEKYGIGDIDDARLKKGIELVSKTYGLSRVPSSSELFTREFLPSVKDRVTSLAVKEYKMLLNSGYSGAQSWFHLASERGYLREEKIKLNFTPGKGAYTAAPRIQIENFDIGYGDVNSLIEVAAKGNLDEAPIGVFMMHNASPSTIAVAKDGPIKSYKDLEGTKLLGHGSDVALQTFPAFAELNGIDASKVIIDTSPKSWEENIQAMLSGKYDGLFGYVSTITTAFHRSKMDIDKIQFLNYKDSMPDFCGSVLMVNRKLYKTQPEVVRLLVNSINQGVVETVADPEAGIYATARIAPDMNKLSERKRLDISLAHEMADEEGSTLGIGDVSESRLQGAIDLMVKTKKLPRRPLASEIFTKEFLPPISQRVTSLFERFGK
mgnify:CR=1 FL=1